MSDYAIQPPTRRCAVTGRELRPGEVYYSAVFEVSGRLERRDYCSDAWQGPPEGAVAHWRAKLPDESDQAAVKLVDDETAWGLFQQLSARPGDGRRERIRYVLALLLLRRKLLKIQDIRSESGRDLLVLKRAGGDELYEVPDPGLSSGQIRELQVELDRLLQGDGQPAG